MHVTYLKRILLLFFLTKSPFLLHLSAGDQVTKVADDSLLKFHNTKNLKRKIVKLIQLIMVFLFFFFSQPVLSMRVVCMGRISRGVSAANV